MPQIGGQLGGMSNSGNVGRPPLTPLRRSRRAALAIVVLVVLALIAWLAIVQGERRGQVVADVQFPRAARFPGAPDPNGGPLPGVERGVDGGRLASSWIPNGAAASTSTAVAGGIAPASAAPNAPAPQMAGALAATPARLTIQANAPHPGDGVGDSGTADSVTWSRVSPNGAYPIQYDGPAMRDATGEYRSIWVLQDFPPTDPQTGAITNSPFGSAKFELQFDCYRDMERGLSYATYADRMGVGRVLTRTAQPTAWTTNQARAQREHRLACAG